MEPIASGAGIFSISGGHGAAAERRARPATLPAGRILAACLAAGLALAAAGPVEARSRSSIAIDARSGLVLQSHNPDARHPPASLSKLMTLYLTFEAISRGRLGWNTRVRISRHAARRPPSKLYLRTGQRVRVRDLVYATAIKSANDAAAALAEKIAGSERRFARLMTRRARQLGMRRTVFGTASGLPARGQRTTARDMAILARSLLHHYPQSASVLATRHRRFGRRSLRNTNRLLGAHPHVDGMKTGYTRRARYNLITSARKGDTRLITVVLGARTSSYRYSKTRRLLASGWQRARNSNYLRRTPQGYVRIAMRSRLGGPAARAARATVSARPKLRPGTPRPVLSLASAAVAAPRPAPAAAPGPRAIHGVQVGAFYRQRHAQVALRRAAKALPKRTRQRARRSIARKNGRGRTLYLARLMGLGLGEAQRACRAVRRSGMDCVPLSAQIPVRVAGRAAGTVGAKPRYAIQVGAFREYRRARRGLDQAQKVLPDRIVASADTRIAPRRTGANRPIYRARIAGLSFRQAREACSILKRRSLSCMTLRLPARG